MNIYGDRAFYSSREVETLTTLSRVTIWRLRRDGMFPPLRTISPGKKGYSISEIQRWIGLMLSGQSYTPEPSPTTITSRSTPLFTVPTTTAPSTTDA
ncbi:helix-turn-helix transcriptional regulator [Rhizobium tumorigenes]|uniref:helix-turn-helix transcriptional regulator n=1 Tax=Rhizobium tumorigenes TaxID=2041385 RepID=UPI003BF9B595